SRMTEIHEDREQQQVAPGEQTSTVATETAAEVNDEQADKKEGIEADASTDMLTPDEVYDQTFVTLEPGQIITGTVVQVSDDEVMVDVGYKSEGRIPQHELGLRPGETPHTILQVGQDIDVYVMKVEDAEGNVLLSKRRADNRLVWEKLESLKESGEVIEATVTER